MLFHAQVHALQEGALQNDDSSEAGKQTIEAPDLQLILVKACRLTSLDGLKDALHPTL
jgi:hypothetical protein